MIELTMQEWLLILLTVIGLLLMIGLYTAIAMLKRMEAERQNERPVELRDETLDAIMAGVRSERQEMQQAIHEVNRSVSTTIAQLGGLLAKQSERSVDNLENLNETARRSLLNMHEVMESRLRDLQGMVDRRFTHAIEVNMKASNDMSRLLSVKFDEIRGSVDGSLEKVRTTNELKLEEMRATVQEKLDKTLAERLTASFKTVDDKLALVEQGLGEMRTMAQSVKDLKGVLTNVKTRGTYGETQLSVILSNILTPAQYGEQVQMIPGEKTVVDFAVRMPGGDTGPCWLPIDSKFPMEDYQRLLDAEEKGDAKAALDARAALSRAVLIQAKSIRDKYLRPPYTTEFAVMFLPSEGLYAEIIRLPDLFERLQREFHITPAGPTVVSALINSLQLGFVTLALQERSSEVWRILGEVKSEFLQFADGFEKVQKKFGEAQRSLDAMRTRQNVMQKKMRSIETLEVSAAKGDEESLDLSETQKDGDQSQIGLN